MNTHAPLYEFAAYGKTPRLFRECIVTEKIDGTNACVMVCPAVDVPIGDRDAVVYGDCSEVGAVTIFAASRTRLITPKEDNYGFAGWVRDNAAELAKLGPGRHYGEWYGRGINRGYGLNERRFALFNVSRWEDGALSPATFQRGVEQPRKPLSPRPACCEVVPVLARGLFDTGLVQRALMKLAAVGSFAAPSFRNPEGVVVFHTAANQVFKVLIENDQSPKGEA